MPYGHAIRRRVRTALLAWYATEQRDFPWRRTRDPYAVLVSEVMLQQTQASRVVPRFERFMRRFPTVESLASAPTAAVLAEWSGLGYNRRALGLQRTAQQIAAGGWRVDADGLAGLPGVGPYTSRAIASLAFGRRVGVVDTNVRRWLVRRLGVTDRPRELQAEADALAASGAGDAAAWTHATMEFGAAICRARNPRCGSCPIRRGCPSRNAPGLVAVPTQAPYPGSVRAGRGKLLAALARAPGHRIGSRSARAIVERHAGVGRASAIVRGLERDGLITRSSGWVGLGPPAAVPSATTIEPWPRS